MTSGTSDLKKLPLSILSSVVAFTLVKLAPEPSVNRTVPVASGSVMVLSWVGSTTVILVSLALAEEPSKVISTPVLKWTSLVVNLVTPLPANSSLFERLPFCDT